MMPLMESWMIVLHLLMTIVIISREAMRCANIMSPFSPFNGEQEMKCNEKTMKRTKGYFVLHEIKISLYSTQRRLSFFTSFGGTAIEIIKLFSLSRHSILYFSSSVSVVTWRGFEVSFSLLFPNVFVFTYVYACLRTIRKIMLLIHMMLLLLL